MRRLLVALAVMSIAGPGTAQEARRAPPEPLARHLVMLTRAGPNFDRIRDHRAEALAHQTIYERLAATGVTIAGGSFQGRPVGGMTIWREGVTEAQAREHIKDDQLPKLGIVEYDFRVLDVRMGSLTPAP